MKDLEAVFITNMLRRHQWNRLRTAKALGIHKSTLFRKIKALHIQIPVYRRRNDGLPPFLPPPCLFPSTSRTIATFSLPMPPPLATVQVIIRSSNTLTYDDRNESILFHLDFRKWYRF